MNKEIKFKTKQLNSLLNYGGICYDQMSNLQYCWENGDIPDEVEQMRLLAKTLLELADIVEQDFHTTKAV